MIVSIEIDMRIIFFLHHINGDGFRKLLSNRAINEKHKSCCNYIKIHSHSFNGREDSFFCSENPFKGSSNFLHATKMGFDLVTKWCNHFLLYSNILYDHWHTRQQHHRIVNIEPLCFHNYLFCFSFASSKRHFVRLNEPIHLLCWIREEKTHHFCSNTRDNIIVSCKWHSVSLNDFPKIKIGLETFTQRMKNTRTHTLTRRKSATERWSKCMEWKRWHTIANVVLNDLFFSEIS